MLNYSRPRRRRGAVLSRIRHARRAAATLCVTIAATLCWSSTASAQLDPLLFLKRVPPTVIIVFDTSLRMLDDGSSNVYDPSFYSSTEDSGVMGAFPNINPATSKTYRRVYRNLQYDGALVGGRYTADSIAAVPAVWDPASPVTSNSPSDQAFLDPTRYAVARAGIDAAVSENAGSSFRWGLVKLRQRNAQWRTATDCEKPVAVADASQSGYGDKTPCDATGLLKQDYGIYAPKVDAPNYSLAAAPAGTVMVTPADNTASSMLTAVRRPLGDNLGLVPASYGTAAHEDRPISYALEDAKAAAIAAITADSAANRVCRNTVIVLITSGRNAGDAAYMAAKDAGTVAAGFASVNAGGSDRRIPIHVIGVKPQAADGNELDLIASASGGQYTAASTAADVTRAINTAVQHGFSRFADFNAGQLSEYVPVSPIVGTVNLKNAEDASGSPLPHTDITASVAAGGQALPQRSNMMITAGFSLPGFDGRVRAFRTYVPESDASQPTGWKFVSDGTRLWPDLDGRPSLAGQARVPLQAADRNIYTYVPNGAGGGSVLAFTAANALLLEPHLRTSGADTTTLIDLVRSQPLGAVIGSTPALMDPPSLDPPPDDDYGRVTAAGTFAGDHKDRRAMIFFGANDGMIHAVDARTGYEVWAFIPYNLLPKLRTLKDGRPVEQFEYFVDSSPKVAEVKINGSWKSLLLIGQGPGGTFYQAFDVTEAGMNVATDLDGNAAVSAMLARFDQPNESIVFKWAFPDYGNFDPSYLQAFTVTDGTPGGKITLYGDLSTTATYAEKTVGFTWSDPAIGPLDSNRSVNALIVGSGYFPDIEDSIPNRTGGPKAGNALYLIDAETGKLVGNASGGSCPEISSGSGSGEGCVHVGDVANGRKNTLQADPSAASDNGNYVVKKAYLGDSDGKYWRFNFTSGGTITAAQMVNTGAPIYASSALLSVGSADMYMFFATGSDLLPASSPGGTGTFRLYGLKDNGASALTKFAEDLATVTAGAGCTATGERPSTAPSVAGDIVFYTTTTERAAAPCEDYSAKLYALTYAGGAAYDANNNGRLDANESAVALTTTGRATSPFIVDQHLFFSTTGADGAAMQVLGDPEDFNNGIGQVGVRILSWREIQ